MLIIITGTYIESLNILKISLSMDNDKLTYIWICLFSTNNTTTYSITTKKLKPFNTKSLFNAWISLMSKLYFKCSFKYICEITLNFLYNSWYRNFFGTLNFIFSHRLWVLKIACIFNCKMIYTFSANFDHS